MRQNKISRSIEKPDHDLLEHIHGLGLGTVEEYRDWCAQRGFSRKLKKHWRQRGRERSYSQQAVAQERLEQKKREKRNPLKTLVGVCEGQLGEGDVTQLHLKRLCQAIRPNRGPKHERQVSRERLLRASLFAAAPRRFVAPIVWPSLGLRRLLLLRFNEFKANGAGRKGPTLTSL